MRMSNSPFLGEPRPLARFGPGRPWRGSPAAHASLAEELAVEIDGGHGHDLLGLDLGGEVRPRRSSPPAPSDSRRPWLDRLHHLGSCGTTATRIPRCRERRLQALDLLDHLRLELGRVAAHLQQRENERGELVPQRQAGEIAPAASPGRVTANAGADRRRLHPPLRAPSPCRRHRRRSCNQPCSRPTAPAVVERRDEFRIGPASRVRYCVKAFFVSGSSNAMVNPPSSKLRMKKPPRPLSADVSVMQGKAPPPRADGQRLESGSNRE